MEEASFVYLDNAADPKLVISKNFSSVNPINFAINSEKLGFDPRDMTIQSYRKKIPNEQISTYKDDIKFYEFKNQEIYIGQNLRGTLPEYNMGAGFRLFAGLAALIYFEQQWGQNERLISLIHGATEPVLIPDDLLKEIPSKLSYVTDTHVDVEKFYNQYDLSADKIILYNFFKTWLPLTAENIWEFEIDSIELTKWYRIPCSENNDGCPNSIRGYADLLPNQIRVEGAIYDLVPNLTLYLPSKNIVVSFRAIDLKVFPSKLDLLDE
ncbi:hypothetical protein [Sneathiella glossodoripedis]|uniref:hypothetical protein n=1 Tax=Sneathiella glossodoripedis TaxID=418853 RepID=UPI0011DCB6B0|nr:hypothetical protein [Sneathiella glossodoripedis]